jgi:transketolase
MTSRTPLTSEQDALAIAMIRGIAMDAPFGARSGHQGTAMALAPLGHVLYQRIMRHDPADPTWIDRDRLVVSNGHASILQYALLHLAGYQISLDDLRRFRQWGSITPGHPEVGVTPGVEVTTGPLGQGFANAVGMAIAERYLRDRLGADSIDHHTYVIAGDGCLMEGVSHEAASLAGHLGLGRLICVFDDNRITIDGSTDLSISDDVAQRFESYGWHVNYLGEVGEDCDAIEDAIIEARAVADRPSLLILRTHIATPSPDHTDDHQAHGLALDAAAISRTKSVLEIPDEPFWVDPDAVEVMRERCLAAGRAEHDEWRQRDGATQSQERSAWIEQRLPAGWSESLPQFEPDESIATRQAFQKVINATAHHFPGLLIGAADLTGNTGVHLSGADVHSAESPGGQQIHYGVREHAMGSIMVGMAHHGGVLPVGGTFFVFSDYMRPALRLAAMSHARVCFVFSHDSVGVGEDGPTHQPIEQLASLRAIPGLQVIRPADANETAHAWRAAVEYDGPTALILTRQAVRVVTDGSAIDDGMASVNRVETPDLILLGTGSEVALCLQAAEVLAAESISARVISLPSWDRLDPAVRAESADLLAPGVPVLSVEAGVTFGWAAFADRSLGIDRFGASAPGDEVMDRLGICVSTIVEAGRELVAEARS